MQRAQSHWRSHGSSADSDSGSYLRGNEIADKEEREAYGRNLPAAYRYLIGPAPKCLPSDLVTARAYLTRIEQACEVGGWTRSEWARLKRLRSKWRARAGGLDARFNIVGNKTAGLNRQDTANVRDRKIVQQMMARLEQSRRSVGD